MKNQLMIERNTEQNEGRRKSICKRVFFSACLNANELLRLLRHNIIELIETEKEYVKDLALIVEVEENNFLISFLHRISFRVI